MHQIRCGHVYRPTFGPFNSALDGVIRAAVNCCVCELLSRSQESSGCSRQAERRNAAERPVENNGVILLSLRNRLS